LANAIDQARQLLEERLAELDAERDQIKRALEQMNGASPARPRQQQRRGAVSSGPAPAASSGKRAPRGQRKQQVLEVVKAKGPVGPSAVAKEVGIAVSQAAKLLAALNKDGRVVKTEDGWKVK
jgi:predicted Rossmann fold nucleotide-binding protein DprA/Smf involved in DNA uptake